MKSDSHLLLDFADRGSQDAFRQLVERHLPLVYRSALRQLNSDTHHAQDVAQMVFTALAKKARPLAAHSNLCAWLYATTHRIACHTIRTEMRRRKREEVWTREAELSECDERSGWSALAPMLDEGVRALATGERDALVLRYFSNRSFAEVGAILGIGEDAARMRVNRALEKLRARFSARGLAVTPTSLASLLSSDTALGAPMSLATTITAGTAQIVPVSMMGSAVLFMTTVKFIPIAAAVAAVLAVGVAIRQGSAARSLAGDLQSAQREVTALRAEISNAERSVTRPVSIPTRSPAPAAAEEDPFLALRAAGDAFLAAHPNIRDLLVRSRLASLRGQYLPLYHERHFTDDQIAEFESLLLGAGGKQWKELHLFVGEHFTPEERERRLLALLGEEGFSQYLLARKIGSGEKLVQQLATRLAYTDEPLSAEKAIEVRDIIDRARVSASAKGDFWAEALPRLEAVVTAAQFDEVHAVYAQERYQYALALATRRTP